MSPQMKAGLVCAAIVVAGIAVVEWWHPFEDYEDCVLRNVKGAWSDGAAQIAMKICQRKYHPEWFK